MYLMSFFCVGKSIYIKLFSQICLVLFENDYYCFIFVDNFNINPKKVFIHRPLDPIRHIVEVSILPILFF